MSYFPDSPNEKPGCLETLNIIRIVLGIMVVPMLLLFGGVFTVVVSLYAFQVHVLLALVPLTVGLGIIALVAGWEKSRYDRHDPPGGR